MTPSDRLSETQNWRASATSIAKLKRDLLTDQKHRDLCGWNCCGLKGGRNPVFARTSAQRQGLRDRVSNCEL